MAKTNFLAGALLVALLGSQAHAWGTKEHILLTNLAAQRVIADPATPPAMKEWLRAVCPDLGTVESQKQFFLTGKVGVTKKDATGMSLWCIEPDNRAGDRNTMIQPFNMPERPLHFVDVEELHAEIDRRAYQHDMSNNVDLATVPRDLADKRWEKAGVLPFAVEHCYKKLVESIKAGRLGDVKESAADADSALVWAGRLAHYLEDNTQPLHATADYQSRSYFADRRGAPNIHSEMEYKMNDDDKHLWPKLRADYWKAFSDQLKVAKDPVQTKDLWMATLEVAQTSYKELPLIGLAAMDASGQQGTPDKPTGRAGPVDTEKFFRYSSAVTGRHETVLQMKARQQAWAVVRVARIWQQAWAEAGQKAE
ncbi:MAG TPA: hypothetical protein VF595_16595 [Tepidisphaeraceae bacterium]|jgi:hypothetical protein